MPKAKKVAAPPKRRTTKKKVASKPSAPIDATSIMAQIIPVSQVEEKGMKMCIYGKSATGKTTVVSTFKKPLLVIGVEDGTRSIRTAKGVDYVPLVRTDDLLTLTEWLPNSKYAEGTAVIDTGTKLQEVVFTEETGKPARNITWQAATQQKWQIIVSKTKNLLGEFLGLAEKLTMNCVITAQERVYENDNEGEGAELLAPFVCGSFSPAVANWLNPECDYVGQTVIKPEFVEETIEIAGETTMQFTATGKTEYAMRVGPHPVYYTKFRRSSRNELPTFITNPTYNKIIELINS